MADAIRANGNVADKALAETLSDDPRMDAPADNVKPGPRNVRSIIAKLNKICEGNEAFTYSKVVAKSKSGGVPTSKAALVAKIVEDSGLTAKQLDGLEKSPKLALETLAARFADLAVANEG